MMKLAIVTMIRNEAGNYLPALLNAWQEFADMLIVLDNNEDDEDAKLIQKLWKKELVIGQFVDQEPAWGNEPKYRQQLFERAAKTDADWLLWLDADMIPLRDPKPLMMNATVDAIAFPLYDLWQQNPLMYREDWFWQAANNPRIWAIRKPSKNFKPEWLPNGLHCGHLPKNLEPIRVVIAPKKFALLHYAYAEEADRMLKHQMYLSQSEILSDFQIAHAESIISPAPELFALPYEPRWEITK